MNKKIPASRKTIGYNPLDSIGEIDHIHSPVEKNKKEDKKNTSSSLGPLSRALKDTLRFTENENQLTSKDVEELFDTEICISGNPDVASVSEVQSKAAMKIIQKWSVLSAAGCVLPGIVTNGIILTTTHIMMLSELCKIYEIRFEKKKIEVSVASILSGGGASLLGNVAAFSLAKQLTNFGAVISAITEPLVGYSTTFALGYTFAKHFENGGSLETLDVKYAKRQISECRDRLGMLVPKALKAQAC